MKKLVAGLALAAVVGLGACAQGSSMDVKGVNFKNPDLIQGFNNVDGYPNVVVMCIDHVALLTTTREAAGALLRVPELDTPLCGAVAGK